MASTHIKRNLHKFSDSAMWEKGKSMTSARKEGLGSRWGNDRPDAITATMNPMLAQITTHHW
jgi:hypothetical protein